MPGDFVGHRTENSVIAWEEKEGLYMPIIYLSPSTQEWNQYVTGSGSEEYNMNLLADALEPYLCRIFSSVAISGIGSMVLSNMRSLMLAALCSTLSSSRGAYCLSHI